MIFELVKDFADALAAMPWEHPRHRILSLMEEALRRDVHFIGRHPTTLFQCMRNTRWRHVCSEAARYHEAMRAKEIVAVEYAAFRIPSCGPLRAPEFAGAPTRGRRRALKWKAA